LVPFNVNVGTREKPRWEKRAQLIPDYRGIIWLVTKPGSRVVAMEARVVKEGDDFSYALGGEPFVHHVPSLDPQRSAKPTTHWYTVAVLADGSRLYDVEDRAGIERVKTRAVARSRGVTPESLRQSRAVHDGHRRQTFWSYPAYGNARWVRPRPRAWL
jgi:recombination protein RecT